MKYPPEHPQYWYRTLRCPECRSDFAESSTHYYAHYGEAPRWESVAVCSQECKTAIEARGRRSLPLPD
jgi:hypothetical protein